MALSKTSWLGCLLCVAVVFASLVSSASANMLENGGFETGDLTGWVSSGGADVRSDDPQTAKEGTYFAWTPADGAYVMQSVFNDLPAGRTFLLTGWCATDGYDYGEATLRFLNVLDAVLDSITSEHLLGNSHEWVPFSLDLEVPFGAVKWEVELKGRGDGSYVCWDGVALDEAATISGTVFESNGVTPITGIEITVHAYTGNPCTESHQWQGSADINQEDGTYIIQRLPAGTNYYLETATQAAYLNEYWAQNSSSPHCENAGFFDLAEGQAVGGKDFQLDQEATISGTIFHRDGGLLTETTVWVNVYSGDPCGVKEWMASACTNPPGSASYTVRKLVAGTYYLETGGQETYPNEWWADPKSSLDCNDAGHITVAAGDTSPDKDFQLDDPIEPGTYYVDIVNGNNGNLGNAANPWQTLHHAIAQINGGSAGTASNQYTLNVKLAGGTHYSKAEGEDDSELIVSQNYAAIIGESGSGPIIDGTDAGTWTKGLEITGSNVTIKNLHITNFSYGIKIYGCNPEISRNTIYDNEYNIGITAGSGETASPIIKNNLIYEITPGPSSKVSCGIMIGGSGTVSPKIYHNTIDGGLYDGIYMDGSGQTPDIKYNIITNFGQFGIENLEGAGHPVIDYNDVWGNTQGSYDDCIDPPVGVSNISSDPNYEDRVNWNYALLGTSPCINAIPENITPVDPVSIDIDGTSRPYGSGYDMGCYENNTLPAVTTQAVTGVGTTSATGNGNITSLGTPNPTAHGVCWNTAGNPTIADTKKDNGAASATGAFTSDITGLTPATTYYVRAYATNSSNSSGTGYGSQVSFTTLGAVYPSVYWVDIQNGSDANNGREETPWKTLHHAISQLNGGSPGTSINWYTLNVKLAGGTHYSKPTEEDSLLVVSQDYVNIIGESGSGPIIDGTGTTTWTTGIKITGSNVTLQNLYITRFTDGIEVEESAGNCTITNCVLYDNSYHGIIALWSQGCSILENKIYGTADPYPNYGIYLIGCSPQIKRNEIYDVDDGIRVVANTGGASPDIWNNLIYEKTSASMTNAIVVKSEDTHSASPTIYHNTLDGGTGKGINIGYEESNGSGALSPDIQYNIITHFDEYGIYREAGVAGTYIIDYNDVWNNTGGNYSDISLKGPNDISANPKYASYTLQSDSPCIDKIPKSTPPSPPTDPVTVDYAGYKRPRGDGYDMGAYEYVAPVTYNYTLPGGIGAVTDYRIFTVPLDLGKGSDMREAMEAVIGSYVADGKGNWRVFAYQGSAYLEMNSQGFTELDIVPGMGFWIITRLTDAILFQGMPAPDGVDYRLVLSPGWHLFGLPWIGTDINLGNIRVTDGAIEHAITDVGNTLTQRYVWDYTGSYVRLDSAGSTLKCGTGYFLRVMAGTDVTLIIPHSNSSLSSAVETAPGDPASPSGNGEEPPPPPGAEPIPGIKAGSPDGSMTAVSGNPISVAVTLDPGAWAGRDADWWVAAHTPFAAPYNWYSYVHPQGWQPGIHRCIKAPLFELTPPFKVWNAPLPPGQYTFYFAVDGNADGDLDVTWMDSVEITVE